MANMDPEEKLLLLHPLFSLTGVFFYLFVQYSLITVNICSFIKYMIINYNYFQKKTMPLEILGTHDKKQTLQVHCMMIHCFCKVTIGCTL